jgi:hypothetical protein
MEPRLLTEAHVTELLDGLRIYLLGHVGEPVEIQSHMQSGIKETTDYAKDTTAKYEYNGCARMALQVVVNPPFKTEDNMAWMVMHRCATCGNPWTGK